MAGKDDEHAGNANRSTSVVLPFRRKLEITADPFEFWVMEPWRIAIAMNCAWLAVATWPFARPTLRRAAVVVPIR